MLIGQAERAVVCTCSPSICGSIQGEVRPHHTLNQVLSSCLGLQGPRLLQEGQLQNNKILLIFPGGSPEKAKDSLGPSPTHSLCKHEILRAA